MATNKTFPDPFAYWPYVAGIFLILLQILNVIPLWSEPVDWGKSIFFRIILSLMGFLFLTQILFKKIEINQIKSKIRAVSLPFYLLAALFIVYLTSTLFSVNVNFSLWGDPARSGGFVNFAFYILFSILIYLTVRAEGWKKILNFLIIIGWLVCLVALIQQLGIFPNFLTPYGHRPISTLGNPIILSTFLLLVTFFPIAMGIAEKNKLKKLFYFCSSLAFFLVSLIMVQTRGAILALFIAFLFFLFFFLKKNKQRVMMAGMVGLLIFFAFLLKIYMDNHVYLYAKIPEVPREALDRTLSIFEGKSVTNARYSTWQVAFTALKDKPLLGYGPENFMVAFDKYYDPTLPQIGEITPGDSLWEWFDRAHNFIFDIAVSAGLLALIIYISFFTLLIYKLQKIGKNNIMALALSSTFIGYIISLTSSFDSVSTYITSFLLIGFSLSIIEKNKINQGEQNKKIELPIHFYKNKLAYSAILAVIFALFIWNYNVMPFLLQKQMNLAMAYTNFGGEKSCQKAIDIQNEIYPEIKKSITNNYLSQKSTFVIYRCIIDLKNTDSKQLVNQAISILKENAERNPQYLTNWLLLGEYTNILIQEKNKEVENFSQTVEIKNLRDIGSNYFEKAAELSPKRQLILKDWADLYMSSGDYQKAVEKLEKCISINPSYARCYWYIALANGYLKNKDKFDYYYNLADEKNYGVFTQLSLQELANMYIRNSDYEGLSETYPKLINVVSDPLEKAQLHASLAASYKEIGDVQKAREEVLKIRKLIPLLSKNQQKAVENDVQAFLEILK